MTTKIRRELTFSAANRSQNFSNGEPASGATYDTIIHWSISRVDSLGNHFKRALDRKTQRLVNLDVGNGAFTTRKAYVEHNFPHHKIPHSNSAFSVEWEGWIIPAAGRVYQPTSGSFIQPSSDTALNAKGVTAIARTTPTNPLAGFGQFLGELHDLPKVGIKIAGWRPRAKSFRDLAKRGADDYLNVVFGWVPFIKDVRDTITSLRNKDKILQQYHRDSGRNIRRRYRFPKDYTMTETVYTSADYCGLYSGNVITPGKTTRTVETTNETWFSGCYTYYLPKGKVASIEADANKLLGVRLSPLLLWQLTPWSWAVDWITNVGDNIHNLVAFANDGLVLRYGYIMETKTVRTTYSCVGLIARGIPQPINSSYSEIQITKCRRKATPYGFGLNSSSFTAKQWAVIAALGISRAPRSLNF